MLILSFTKFTFSSFSPFILLLSFSLEFYGIVVEAVLEAVLSERIKNVIIDSFIDLSFLKPSETKVLKLRGRLDITLLY